MPEPDDTARPHTGPLSRRAWIASAEVVLALLWAAALAIAVWYLF